MNISLVTGAHARARTLTLDWRHWLGGGLALSILFVAFTLVFICVTLRWAPAVLHPGLPAIVLADQRAERVEVAAVRRVDKQINKQPERDEHNNCRHADAN